MPSNEGESVIATSSGGSADSAGSSGLTGSDGSSGSTNSALKSTLRKYYGFQAGIQVLFWVPIFYSYQILMGLTDSQYFEIQSIYYWIFCFLELPTGWIADRFSYRRTMTLAGVTMALSSLSAIFWVTPLGFLGHFTIIAFARALTSGAANAYLFEYLSANGAESEYKRYEGRARSLSLTLRIFAWSAAGYLFTYKASLPYWLTVVACLLAGLCAYLLPKLPEKGATKKRAKASFTAFVTYLKQHRRLFWAMVAGAGLFVMTRISLVNLFQPLLTDKGVSASMFGWILAGLTLFEAFGSDRAHLLKSKWSDHSAIFVCTLGAGICLCAIAFANSYVTTILFCVFSIFTGLAFPIVRQAVNDEIIDTSRRATLLSVESILHRVFMGTAAMACAFAVKVDGIQSFLVLASVICVSLVAVSLLFLRQRA